MSALHLIAERGPPQHPLLVTGTEQIGQVGMSVRELLHCQRPVWDTQAGAEVGFQLGQVEFLAGPHRAGLVAEIAHGGLPGHCTAYERETQAVSETLKRESVAFQNPFSNRALV